MQAPCASDCSGRMRGVADEDDAALVPVAHRIAIADRPAPPEIHHRQQRLHRRLRVAVAVLSSAR